MLHLTILTVLPSIGHCMALSLQINNDIIYIVAIATIKHMCSVWFIMKYLVFPWHLN